MFWEVETLIQMVYTDDKGLLECRDLVIYMFCTDDRCVNRVADDRDVLKVETFMEMFGAFNTCSGRWTS